MSDTLSTAELQDLHVQPLPARTVMTAMGAPTGMGGLSDALDDFTGRQSIPLSSSSADGSSADGSSANGSSADGSSADGSSAGGADGQVGGSGTSGGDGGMSEGGSSSDVSESG
ncbi:MAG: hypothetical protein ACRDRK_06780 [Pseudonocardia sp.]